MRSAWLVAGLLVACTDRADDFDIVAVVDDPAGYAIVTTHAGALTDEVTELFDEPVVTSVADFVPVLSANGRYAAIRTDSGALKIVATTDGAVRYLLPFTTETSARALAVSDDGRRAALVTGATPTLKNFDLETMMTEDLGAVGAAPVATYAGADLYANTGIGMPLIRSAAGGPATVLGLSDMTSGYPDVTVMAGEPNGTRVYFGAADTLLVLESDALMATVVETGDAMPAALDALAAGPGGVLAFHAEAMWVTGKNASAPKSSTAFPLDAAPAALGVAPDGSAAVFAAGGMLVYESRGASEAHAVRAGVHALAAR